MTDQAASVQIGHWAAAHTVRRRPTDLSVIAGHVARGAYRWALIWGAVLGLYVLATIRAFVAAYPTVAQRTELARSLQSFALILGTPYHAETVAGFTTWRVLTASMLMTSTWGLLTSTAAFRGEEDAGRWELLLAAPTTRKRAAIATLLGLARAYVAMTAVVAVMLSLCTRLPGARFGTPDAVLFAVALTASAAMFLAIGALASQLSGSRGVAVAISVGILGLSLIVRTIADSSTSLNWLRWFTPVGWLEQVRPLQDMQALALAPVLILVGVGCVLTVRLAERRDLDAGLLPERTTRAASGRWLRGPTSLAVRLSRTTMLSWILGVSVYAFMFGALTRSATTMLSTSPAITAALGRLGVRRATDGFLDMAFFFDSVALALLAASIVGAMRDEEASGRLENLIVGPVTRTRWLIGRAGVGLCTLLLAALAAAVCTWFGATTQHLNPGLPRLLQAGLNAGAPSAFVLGLGVLVLGVRPRLTAAAAYGPVAWSVLVNLVGALVKNADWLKDSSLFSHIALAPAANVDWASDLVVVLLGLSATVVGAIWFNTRDISNA